MTSMHRVKDSKGKSKKLAKFNINLGVSESNDKDEATEFFDNSFRYILDKHAQMKTIQIRKNFSPFLSNNMKEIILTKNLHSVLEGDLNGNNSMKMIFTKY